MHGPTTPGPQGGIDLLEEDLREDEPPTQTLFRQRPPGQSESSMQMVPCEELDELFAHMNAGHSVCEVIVLTTQKFCTQAAAYVRQIREHDPPFCVHGVQKSGGTGQFTEVMQLIADERADEREEPISSQPPSTQIWPGGQSLFSSQLSREREEPDLREDLAELFDDPSEMMEEPLFRETEEFDDEREERREEEDGRHISQLRPSFVLPFTQGKDSRRRMYPAVRPLW